MLPLDDAAEVLLLLEDPRRQEQAAAEANNLLAGLGLDGVEALPARRIGNLHNLLRLMDSSYNIIALFFFILGTTVIVNTTMMVIFERLRQVDNEPVFLRGGLRPACTAYWERLKANAGNEPIGKQIQASIDDMAIHRCLEQVAQSGVAIFGWGSWMDAGTAEAVIRRYLTLENAPRAVIGAWEHGGQSSADPYLPPNHPVNPSLPAQWAEMSSSR